jgi:hypothetical protein
MSKLNENALYENNDQRFLKSFCTQKCTNCKMIMIIMDWKAKQQLKDFGYAQLQKV